MHEGRVTLIERREKLRVNDDDAGPIFGIGLAATYGTNWSLSLLRRQ